MAKQRQDVVLDRIGAGVERLGDMARNMQEEVGVDSRACQISESIWTARTYGTVPCHCYTAPRYLPSSHFPWLKHHISHV